MPHLFLAVPSYRGLSDDAARALVDTEALHRAGIQVTGAVLRGVADLYLARNELLAIAHESGADYTLWQDDDVQTAPSSIRDMVSLADKCGFDVLSAPVQMSHEGRAPNFVPLSPPLETADGHQVCECAWVGFGSVLVSRRATEALIAEAKDHHYMRRPGRRSWRVFRPETVPASAFVEDRERARRCGWRGPDDPAGEQLYLGDDLGVCHRMRQLGIKVRAFLFAVTDHKKMGRYCFGEAAVAAQRAGR